MTLVDRFICRREGHLPSFVIHKTSGVILTTYATTCRRCGKWIEVDVEGNWDRRYWSKP